MAISAALTSGLVIPTASADQISDLKAQAAAISAKMSSLGLQEDALSEKYDAAVLQVQQLQAKVQQAQAQLAAAQTATAQARQALKADAVQAYVEGGNSPLQSGPDLVRGATESLLRAEYINTLVTDQSNAVDRYRLAAVQEQAASDNLSQQVSAANAQLQQVQSARTAVANTAAQLTSMQNQVKGQLAAAVAQQQAAEEAAAAAAAAARVAAQQAAQQAAAQAAARLASESSGAPASSDSGGSPVGVPAFNPPPPGSGASGAVGAAESRVGDWYEWGAAGPNTFDCSGLVEWAYAQVGISLPHYSGAQYSDTTHIPMSDLQPGDLVFFSDPGEHVAMYVGNGEIVEAAHTGTQVHVIPMYSEFVLASRVE